MLVSNVNIVEAPSVWIRVSLREQLSFYDLPVGDNLGQNYTLVERVPIMCQVHSNKTKARDSEGLAKTIYGSTNQPTKQTNK